MPNNSHEMETRGFRTSELFSLLSMGEKRGGCEGRGGGCEGRGGGGGKIKVMIRRRIRRLMMVMIIVMVMIIIMVILKIQ